MGFFSGFTKKVFGAPGAAKSVVQSTAPKITSAPYHTIGEMPKTNRYGGLPGTKAPAVTQQQAAASRLAKIRRP